MALRMLASIASKRGDFFEAERLLKQCLQLAPGYAEARFDLANELYAQQRHAEVLPLVERLLATYPGEVSYLGLKAQALRLHGRNAEAIALMRQAVETSPGNAKLRLLYGHLLREIGEQAEAIDAYRQGLALQPGMGEAYWSLANLKTVRFSEADLEGHAAAAGPAALRWTPTGPLSSSRWAKALEDAGQYADSFEHYAHGNALHRAMVFHDPRLVHEVVERSKALYQPAFFAARSGWGSERADPIFIVGMPRSGSTLLEQILASHSQVEGTRELPEVPAIVRELIVGASAEALENYPELLSALGRPDIEARAARYLERTAVHRPLGRPRFVDKLLVNFLHVGLIHLMFPRATIIDSRRHPLGCCFSCFKQFFARGLYFTYDQDDLGAVLPGLRRSHGAHGHGAARTSASGALRGAGDRSRGRGAAPARALRFAVRGGVPALLREPPGREHHQFRAGPSPHQRGCRGALASLRTLAGWTAKRARRADRSLSERFRPNRPEWTVRPPLVVKGRVHHRVADLDAAALGLAAADLQHRLDGLVAT